MRSGSGASFSTFTGTGEAFELSKLSAAAAEARRERGGVGSDILVTTSACLEQDLAPVPSPSVLFAREMLLL